MALRNAFAALVTEPIAYRLNQIVSVLTPLALTIERSTGTLRANIISAIPTVNTVTTVSTVTTCSTVTTTGTLTNQTNIGGLPATLMVLDSMATRWASSLRGRIT